MERPSEVVLSKLRGQDEKAQNPEKKYISRETEKKAKSKKILETDFDWNGEMGIFLVEGEYGTNVHTVLIRKENNKLSVYCSCMGFMVGGICSHVVLVLNDLERRFPDLKPLIETWFEERKKEKEARRNGKV